MLEIAFHGHFDSFSVSSLPRIKSTAYLSSYPATAFHSLEEDGLSFSDDPKMGSGGDVAATTCCAKVSDVLSLSANPITFGDTWYYMFIWSLFSSFLVHSLAALVALCKLYQHPIGRFYPVLIFLMGIVSPLTAGACTSAVIAAVFVAASWTMPAATAMCIGIAQTIIIIVVSTSRILATL